jgi:hypothetical protein
MGFLGKIGTMFGGNSDILFFILVFLFLFNGFGSGAEGCSEIDSTILFFIILFLLLFFNGEHECDPA